MNPKDTAVYICDCHDYTCSETITTPMRTTSIFKGRALGLPTYEYFYISNFLWVDFIEEEGFTIFTPIFWLPLSHFSGAWQILGFLIVFVLPLANFFVFTKKDSRFTERILLVMMQNPWSTRKNHKKDTVNLNNF